MVTNHLLTGMILQADVLCCIAGCQDLVELYAAGEEPRPDVNDCHRSMRGAKNVLRLMGEGDIYIYINIFTIIYNIDHRTRRKMNHFPTIDFQTLWLLVSGRTPLEIQRFRPFGVTIMASGEPAVNRWGL